MHHDGTMTFCHLTIRKSNIRVVAFPVAAKCAMAAAPVEHASGPARMASPRRPETLQTEDMSEQEQAEIRLEFARLKQEHLDFDAAINAMIAMGCDALQVQRMKKKKLALKDRLKNPRGQDHSRHHRLIVGSIARLPAILAGG